MAPTRSASQVGRDYFWNTAASGMISASSVVMTLLVTRFLGLEAAGVFTVATAAGQLGQTVGMYEVRPFHVTDVRRRFASGHYVATRFLTVGAALAGIVAYGLLAGDSTTTCLALVLVACLKLVEAFEDVYVSEFQRSGRLDVGARAWFWRVVATTVVFVAAILVTGSLVWGTAVSLAVAVGTTMGLYLPAARGLVHLSAVWDRGQVRRILVDCLPLFAASFLGMYLAKAPNFAIDHYLSKEAQGYFANIFMPAMVINLLSLVVFRPLLTTMGEHWTAHRVGAFLGVVRKGLVTTGAAAALAAVAGWFAGVPVLGLATGADFSAYRGELMVLIAGGTMNAVSVVFYYALATMRLQRLIFAGYAVAAVAITAACAAWVPMMGIMGACLAYTTAMTVLSAFFAVPVLAAARHRVDR